MTRFTKESMSLANIKAIIERQEEKMKEKTKDKGQRTRRKNGKIHHEEPEGKIKKKEKQDERDENKQEKGNKGRTKKRLKD